MDGTTALVFVWQHLVAFVAYNFEEIDQTWLVKHRVFKSPVFAEFKAEQARLVNHFDASVDARVLAALGDGDSPQAAALRELGMGQRAMQEQLARQQLQIASLGACPSASASESAASSSSRGAASSSSRADCPPSPATQEAIHVSPFRLESSV